MFNNEMLRALRASNTDKEILIGLVNDVVNHTRTAQNALQGGKTEYALSKLGQISTSVEILQVMVRGLNDGFKMDRKEEENGELR
jgi:hypothetical protein